MATRKQFKPPLSFATIRQAQREINKMQSKNPGRVYHVLHHPKESGRYVIVRDMSRPKLRVMPTTPPAPLSETDLWDLHWECRMKAAFLEGAGKPDEGAKWRALAERVLASRKS